MGREQLKRLPDIVQRRRQLVDRYRAMFNGDKAIHLPVEPAWARSNWQSFCVQLPEEADQRRIMQRMLDEGIATRRGIMCSHREQAYRDLSRHQQLPRSEHAQDHCILLPLYDQMTDAEQEAVVSGLRKAVHQLVERRIDTTAAD